MNTRKPISTISYNSPEFLKNVLDYLVQHSIIEFYAFIFHKGEYNNTLNEYEKDHFHIFAIPNGKVNTVNLSDYFIEYVDGEELPRKCILWCTSNVDDWILYCLHDENYLMTKFEVKEYHYVYDDFNCSDPEQFKRFYRFAYESSGYARAKNIFSYFASNGKLLDLMAAGIVTPQTATHWQTYDQLYRELKKTQGTSIK